MMRSTIHLAAAADYWPLNVAIRESRRTWFLRQRKASEADVLAAAARTRSAFEQRGRARRAPSSTRSPPRTAPYIGLFVDLVRVPPSGTWERRRADLFALAERWVGPQPAIDERRGVASTSCATTSAASDRPAAAEIASWAGVKVGTINGVVAGHGADAVAGRRRRRAARPPRARRSRRRRTALPRAVHRDVGGRCCSSTPGAPRSSPRRTAHASSARGRRSRSTRSSSTGPCAARGGSRTGTSSVAPWRPLTPAQRAAVDDEAGGSTAFHA